MAELKKNIYIEKAKDTEKHRLVGDVRAKAAEMAKQSDKEERQAEEALYKIWFKRSRESAN